MQISSAMDWALFQLLIWRHLKTELEVMQSQIRTISIACFIVHYYNVCSSAGINTANIGYLFYIALMKKRIKTPGGELPFEEYTGVCHELGSYFQEKIPKMVCQFFTKIPEGAIISVRNSR